MALYMFIGFILSTLVLESHSLCKDIDPQACQVMQQQNPEICFEAAVASTACPKFCKQCAYDCYFCDGVSSADDCNKTQTCQKGEFCMIQTVRSQDGMDKYTLSCARPELCNGMVGKRDVSIQCCSDDLCNGPTSTTTVTMPTTSTVKTTAKPTPTTTTATTTTATVQPVVMTTTSKNTCARDLIFVVDDSTTMALVFSTVKQFIANLVAKQVIGPSDTLVSMATFALTARSRWDLDRYNNQQELLNAIQKMKPDIATISDGLSGLNYVINHVVKSRYGDRPGVPDDVIFISDGSWHQNLLGFLTGKNDQRTTVAALHRSSNNVIAIGIGPANTYMIHNVATDSAHSIRVHRASDLSSIENRVLGLICGN